MAARYIFSDFDGVICDTEPIHYRAFAEILRERDVDLVEDDYYTKYCHGDDHAIMAAILKDYSIDDPAWLESAVERKGALGLEMMRSDLPVLEGAVSFLRRCIASGVRLAVVSMARRKEVELGLEVAGLRDVVEFIVSSEDVTNVKPDPDPYLRAFEKAGKSCLDAGLQRLKPGDCLVLEDTSGGVRAGKSAGLRVWGTGSTQSPEELSAAGAEAVYPDLGEAPMA